MTPQDMARLHAACFTAPPPWSAESFASLLADPHVLTCIAPELAGFLLARVIAGEGEVLTVATDPARRRQGIARALMQAFEARARALGAERLFLEVAEDNAPARALYRSCGFVQTGRRPGYYVAEDGRKADALILCKSLAPALI